MDDNFKFKRGSVWRKWDIHVHTPFTKLNDQYVASSEDEKWDLFCDKIENSDVSVFGITDYFSINNYFSFIEKFNSKFPNSKKIFFPNIEFRIESKNKDGDHIQFHVIFSNKKETTDKILNFFTRLKLVSTDDINLTNKYCVESDLQKVTFKKAMVKIDDLENQLKSDFSNSEYFIIGLARGYGSLRPDLNDSRGDEYAKELDKKCKVFLGSSMDVNFFLNKIEGRQKYGLLPKPVLFGCDAHSFADLDNRLGKTTKEKDANEEVISYSETTWIKADPTFDGLKQIIFEPIDRVKIQELKPEEKESYYIIDNVNFKDDNFTTEILPINQNLTVIIGGKSTGKSILLRNIAKAVDINEVESRLNEVGLLDYDQEVDNFEVTWNDGQKDKKNEQKETTRKIIYIPQSYLNRLVDKKEDKTSIDDIIKNVIKQDPNVNLAFDGLDSQIRNIERDITLNIDNLFYFSKDIKTQSDSIKEIGHKKGVEDEVLKLEKEVEEFKKKVGMTPVQINEYNILLADINTLKKDKEKIESDINNLGLLVKENIFIDFSSFTISDNIKESLKQDFEVLKFDFSTKWIEKINSHISILSTKLKEKNASIALKNQSFIPLLEKAKENKSLKEKILRLENEKQKLSNIINQEGKLNNLKSEHNKVLLKLVELHALFYDNFFETKAKILKQTVIDGEISFGLDITFKQNYFQENFVKEVFNLQKVGRFSDVSLLEYKYIDSATFKQNIEQVMKGILSEKIILKNNYSQKEAITKLLQNWYIFDYKIRQNKDEISQMSPGKKSFVLLKLLVELDKSRCPILLDQPEDDLDNRSIYYDLVEFVKTKKKDRQIIIATHNPNLVVGADAECVIVANQKGERTPNKTYNFEYVSGSLENTFENKTEDNTLYQKGIKEHTCDILEGGKEAFNKRERKYDFNKM